MNRTGLCAVDYGVVDPETNERGEQAVTAPILGSAHKIVDWKVENTLSGHICHHTLGIICSDADALDFATVADAAWSDHMMGGACSVNYSYRGVDVIGETVTQSVARNLPGSGFTAGNPAQAILAKKITGVRGRANRGRMYLCGGFIPEGGVGPAGELLSGLTADTQSNLDALGSALASATAGFAPVILHGGSSDATPIVGLIVEPTVATQRRRLVRPA